jgi:hypothetical protein
VANLQTIIPAIESLKCAPSPKHAELHLRKRTRNAILVPALEIAMDLGNAKLSNCVMLGILSTLLEFPSRAWMKAMTELYSQDDLERKHIAFSKGIAWLQETHPDAPNQHIDGVMHICRAPDLLHNRILAKSEWFLRKGRESLGNRQNPVSHLRPQLSWD